MTKVRITAFTMLLMIAALAVACGDSSGDDEPEATTTSAGETTTTAGATTTAGETTTTAGGTTTTESSGGGAVELKIEAEDSEGYTKDRLEAPAGVEVSVVFQNKDIGGEPHNWHLVVVSGSEEYATRIAEGPDTQEVTFTIGAPGEYLYLCDTHSETMKGVLTVTP